MLKCLLRLIFFMQMLFAFPVQAGWIGVRVQDSRADDGTVRGVAVVDAGVDTPAARAGLQAGDVIISVKGIPVASTLDFVRIVREAPAGEPMEMRVVKEGETVVLAPVAAVPPRGIADLQRGIDNLEKGRHEQAVRDFTNIIESDHTNANAYFYRARAHQQLGRCDRAVADFSKCIELNPKALTAFINRGRCYDRMNLFEQAVSDFTKAIGMEPKMAPLYVERGNSYLRKGLIDKAIEDCTKAVELLPKMDIAYRMRADAYAAKGMKQEALADYERAAAAYIESGLESARKGNLEGALRRFDSAIQLKTRHSSKAFYNRGVVYEKKGEHVRALNDYTEAIRLNPSYAEAYLRRGYVFAQNLRDYGNARKDWEKAKSLDPSGEFGRRAAENLGKLGGGR